MKKLKYGYIYLTTCKITNIQYVGKHTNIWVRKHQRQDPKYKGSGTLFKKALKKYGFENFETIILEWCYSEEELKQREEYYLTLYNVINTDEFYNLVDISGGGCMFNNRGEDFYKATCKKISDSKKKLYNSEEGALLKQQIADTLWNNLSKEKKEEYRRLASENSKKGWANMSDVDREQFKEKCRQHSSGKNNPAARKVKCIETGEEFDTIKEARLAGYKGDIGKVCRGGAKCCGGYSWKFIDNKYEDNNGVLVVKEKKKYNCTKKRPHTHVLCVETEEVFDTFLEVANIYNCSENTVRNRCIDGKLLGNYHWKAIK